MRPLFILALIIMAGAAVQAQQTDFCDAVNTIVNDAPAKFRNLRGKVVDARPGAGMWESSIKVPGVISARFVVSMGVFYEGALHDARTKDGLDAAYEKWKAALSACLEPQGYKLWKQDNFYPGLGHLKKLAFMKEIPEKTAFGNTPAHVTLEAQYSKQTGKYTIVMYIYEH